MDKWGDYEADTFLPSPEQEAIEWTPWAPLQWRGMKCACRSWEARDCVRARGPCNPFDDPDEMDDDERCECCCHDRDIANATDATTPAEK